MKGIHFALSSLFPKFVYERMNLQRHTMNGIHNHNEREFENKDKLGDLPDCVLLHILSFLNTKEAVQTCILSTRWKHLWKRLSTLTLGFGDFNTLESFTEFVSKFLSLHDSPTALNALDIEFWDPLILERILKYAPSHNLNRLRLGNIDHFPSSLFSCWYLTSLDLSFPLCHEVIFPNSLNLPALTDLKLQHVTFCSGSDGRFEPFSTFNMLNTLTLSCCIVQDAPLCISSTTLLNLLIYSPPVFYGRYYGGYLKIIEISAPDLFTFAYRGQKSMKFSGSSLSSIKQASIDIDDCIYSVTSLDLLHLLQEMTGIKSLIVTPTTLKALSLVPDILKFKLTSWCNLKSLNLNLIPYSYSYSVIFSRDMKLELAGGMSWKENVKLRETIKAELVPIFSSILDEMMDFLLQNSPSAKVDILITDPIKG